MSSALLTAFALSCLAALSPATVPGPAPSVAPAEGSWLDAQPVELELGNSYPIRLFYRRTAPGLGTMGVGWRVTNLTNDRLEVELEKSYSVQGRKVATRKGKLFVEPRETVNGGRFFGDDIFTLWDDLFYGEELKAGERISGVSARVSVKNLGEQERKAQAERERVEREQAAQKQAQQRAEEERAARERAQEQSARVAAQRAAQQRQQEANRQAHNQRVMSELEAKLAAIERSRNTAIGLLESLKDHHLKSRVREHARDVERAMRENARRSGDESRSPCAGCGGVGFERCTACDAGFTECDGFLCERGRIACLACSRTGLVFGQTCANCKGQGDLACTTCGGSGREACTTCWTIQLDECGRCGGDGAQ